jgi:UDP-N-acetylmuramoyl-L-alanyl-D-glutamate--2,6-diaminopimelate ligase
VTLRDVLEDVQIMRAQGTMETEVTGLAYDSRRVRPGDLFFGLSGLKQDGQAYVRQALTAGAVAAVVERDTHLPGATLVQVGETRTALAQASARFFRFPSRALRIVGVTGTNGKTTTTLLLDAVFRAAGWQTGVVGTTGVRLGDERRPAAFTTPEAPELQGLLREMADLGIDAVAIEVSSHALAQRRSFGLECDVVVFTNLTQDHLDYHGTMDAYRDAKEMLFDGRNGPNTKPAVAVVNIDDPAAAEIRAAARRGGMREMCYSTDPDGPDEGISVHAEGIRPVPGGLEIQVSVDLMHGKFWGKPGEGESTFTLPLLGRHNASNASAAFTAGLALGIDPRTIMRGLELAPPVPGRLERVDTGRPFEVIVDYAHTPDALVHALGAVREHVSGRILTVFGCGGDRDRGKRPLMGRAAAEGSDVAWVTSDNPRSEDPRSIADAIVAGAPAAALRIELDRRAAIGAALAEARPGDAVLIAGKGHETTQTFADRTVPFDDREVARALAGGAGG